MTADFISILRERGLVHQCTAMDELLILSKANAVRPYIGFDLTADSLHVGSLIQLMVLRWAAKSGIRSTILLGGFTSRVGDPTGRKDARPMLSIADVIRNQSGIERVIYSILDYSNHDIANNDDWLRHISLSDFITQYAPLFSVNRMLAMDSVKARLAAQDTMSVMEFNYSLFQAIDFLHLNDGGVNLQIGGSDQWANIISGVDLIRRKKSVTAYGLTTPLMTNSAGEKMGKTAGGAIWLSATKTPVQDFFQFWRNIEDTKVEEFLRLFTELPLPTISSIMAGDINAAKERLAHEVTAIVHGVSAATKALRTAKAVFGGEGAIDPDTIQTISLPLLDAPLNHLVAAVASVSKSEAARLIEQRGVKIDTKVGDRTETLVLAENHIVGDLLAGITTPFILKVGKNRAFPLRIPMKKSVETE